MSDQREWHFYMGDMLEFAEKVMLYTAGFDQHRFVNSGLTYNATVRNLELIGEAATHVPDDIKEHYSQTPWRLIVATRNRLIHGYLGIDQDTLWSIIQTDISSLHIQPAEIYSCLQKNQ